MDTTVHGCSSNSRPHRQGQWRRAAGANAVQPGLQKRRRMGDTEAVVLLRQMAYGDDNSGDNGAAQSCLMAEDNYDLEPFPADIALAELKQNLEHARRAMKEPQVVGLLPHKSWGLTYYDSDMAGRTRAGLTDQYGQPDEMEACANTAYARV